MNKEEIEKEDREHLIKVLTEHKDYIFEFDDDNIKIEYILDYIRELEFQNTAFKTEHNYNITRIKKLEQKESILDKVTDTLKERIKELDKLKENYIKLKEYDQVDFTLCKKREIQKIGQYLYTNINVRNILEELLKEK